MKSILFICLLFQSFLFAIEGNPIHESACLENCRTCHPDESIGTTAHIGMNGTGCTYCHRCNKVDMKFTAITVPTNTDCTRCHINSENYRVNAAHEVFACTTCHDPHGTEFDHLLKQSANSLCANNCHRMEQLGRSHPRGSGATDIHTGRELTCISSCHKIHTSSSDKLLALSPPYLCASCHADKF